MRRGGGVETAKSFATSTRFRCVRLCRHLGRSKSTESAFVCPALDDDDDEDAMLISEGFQQTPLALQPLYTSDPALRALLERLLPAPIFKTVDAELVGFQSRLAGPIHELALLADAGGEPTLTQFDHWGRRVDVLSTSEGWRRLKGVAAEEG
jgi:hypothetical protein